MPWASVVGIEGAYVDGGISIYRASVLMMKRTQPHRITIDDDHPIQLLGFHPTNVSNSYPSTQPAIGR